MCAAISITFLHIILKENTLALDDVVVTAQAPKNELNTTLTIGNNALEHLQVSNVSDISALLPGGKTKVPDLTANNIFSLRDGGQQPAMPPLEQPLKWMEFVLETMVRLAI